MGEKTTGSGPLKQRVQRRTGAFAIAGATALGWLNLGMPAGLEGLLHSPPPARVISAASVLLGLLVVAVDALPGPDLKAQVVFIRRRHPLPGSRAFERANLDRDTRIDRDRLRALVGGAFPRAPDDQNATWYRLYKKQEDDARVEHAHFQWILFRDLTWLSLVLLVLAVAATVANADARMPAFGGALAVLVLLLVFRRAAAVLATRFVNTVLALASTTPPTSLD
ncbi:MAG: hypothetical protein ACLP1X_26715 [Polyangiaceae bacterium]